MLVLGDSPCAGYPWAALYFVTPPPSIGGSQWKEEERYEGHGKRENLVVQAPVIVAWGQPLLPVPVHSFQTSFSAQCVQRRKRGGSARGQDARHQAEQHG